jgi:hypothetical protein
MGKVWFCNIQPLRTGTASCDCLSLVRGKLLWAPGPTVVETEAPLPSRNTSRELPFCGAIGTTRCPVQRVARRRSKRGHPAMTDTGSGKLRRQLTLRE